MTRFPMTIRGAKRLRDELQRRKNDERPRITVAIAEARAHGDLKENAEYHAAREEQGLNEARINDIESKLSNAEIIDVTKIEANERVVFGATVRLLNAATGDETAYQIVGEDEANIKDGMVSVNSPLARALIGKSQGEYAVVQAPGGEIEYEIIGIRYG